MKKTKRDEWFVGQLTVFFSVVFFYYTYLAVGPYIFMALMVAPWFIGAALLYARDKLRSTEWCFWNGKK